MMKITTVKPIYVIKGTHGTLPWLAEFSKYTGPAYFTGDLSCAHHFETEEEALKTLRRLISITAIGSACRVVKEYLTSAPEYSSYSPLISDVWTVTKSSFESKDPIAVFKTEEEAKTFAEREEASDSTKHYIGVEKAINHPEGYLLLLKTPRAYTPGVNMDKHEAEQLKLKQQTILNKLSDDEVQALKKMGLKVD